MADIIDTLHPENSLGDNLYPNIKSENIPAGAILIAKLAQEVLNYFQAKLVAGTGISIAVDGKTISVSNVPLTALAQAVQDIINRADAILKEQDGQYGVIAETINAEEYLSAPTAEISHLITNEITLGGQDLDTIIISIKSSSIDNKYHIGAYDTVAVVNGITTITRQTGYDKINNYNISIGDLNAYNGTCTQMYVQVPKSQYSVNTLFVSNILKQGGFTPTLYEAIITNPSTNVVLLWFNIPLQISNENAINYAKSLNIIIQYKLATPYTEQVITDRPLNTLDQQGSQWVRNEWEKGLNLWKYLNTYSNTNTDTKTSFSCVLTINGELIEYRQVETTGVQSFTFTTPSNPQNLLCKHSGSILDLVLFNVDVSYLKPNTDYTISFYVNGYNATVVGGISITNIMLNEGDHAYPYKEFNGEIVHKKDLEPYAKTADVNADLSGKVDKETGKGLSTNDYTNEDKAVVEGLNAVQTTTDTVANVIDVPTSAKGLATLKQIGGMSYKCSNLFSDDYYFGDYYVDTTGTYVNNNYNCYCVPVRPNTTYTLAHSDNSMLGPSGGIIEFRSDTTTRISTDLKGYGNTQVTFTTPSNCHYIVFSKSKDQTFNIMLNEGSTALPYEAYYEGIHDSAVTKVESVGANRLNPSCFKPNNSIQSDGTLGTYPNYSCYYKVLIEPNTSYTITANGERIRYDLGMATYDINGNFINYGVWYNSKGTTASNVYYISFDFPNNLTNIMLNKGSTALPYAQHKTYELAIPQAIRSITGYGWGVNENCYNYIDLSLKQFKQYVGRVDFKDLTCTAVSYDHFATIILPSKYKAYGAMFSDKCAFSNNPSWQGYGENTFITVTEDSLIIYLYFVDVVTTNDVNTWLQASSGTLLYELATPVITDISSLLDEVHIPIEAGGTLELVNTHNNAVPVIVSFDNGLADMVKTNHEHDIEQQKDIDELKSGKQDKLVFTGAGQNIKTVGGFSLEGSGNIPLPSGTNVHAATLTLYANGWQPVFRTQVMVSTSSYGTSEVTTASNGLFILELMSGQYQTDVYVCTFLQPNPCYWDGSQMNTDYPNAAGTVYDKTQDIIDLYDNTGQLLVTINTSDIGDDDNASYFFYLSSTD